VDPEPVTLMTIGALIFLTYLIAISMAGHSLYLLHDHTRRTPKNWFLHWVNLRKALLFFFFITALQVAFIHQHMVRHIEEKDELHRFFHHMKMHRVGEFFVFSLYVFFIHRLKLKEDTQARVVD
jgi:hypothetical protein